MQGRRLRARANCVAGIQDQYAAVLRAVVESGMSVDQKRREVIEIWRRFRQQVPETDVVAVQSRRAMRGVILSILRHWRRERYGPTAHQT